MEVVPALRAAVASSEPAAGFEDTRSLELMRSPEASAAVVCDQVAMTPFSVGCHVLHLGTCCCVYLVALAGGGLSAVDSGVSRDLKGPQLRWLAAESAASVVQSSAYPRSEANLNPCRATQSPPSTGLPRSESATMRQTVDLFGLPLRPAAYSPFRDYAEIRFLASAECWSD